MTKDEKTDVLHTLKFMTACHKEGVKVHQEGIRAMDELCLKYTIPKEGWAGECRRKVDRRKD